MYLIAHKYCGQPTFDVASRMPCPLCTGINITCDECDDGYWWILNDGHRAWPYWARLLIEIMPASVDDSMVIRYDGVPEMPDDARDSYPAPNAEPAAKPPALRGLLSKIGLIPKIERRL